MDFFDAASDIAGGIVGDALTCVVPMVDEIFSTLGNQQGMVTDLVQAPIQAMIEEVSGGIWTGDGATAFMDECQNDFLSSASNLIGGIGGVLGGITAAVDAVESADRAAANLVPDLEQEFTNIAKDLL